MTELASVIWHAGLCLFAVQVVTANGRYPPIRAVRGNTCRVLSDRRSLTRKRPVDTTDVASFKMVPEPNVQPVAFTFLARLG